jgi:hypothetical protein
VIDSVKARRARAMQCWLDECDPQIREHCGAESAKPADPRQVDRAIAWVREYADTHCLLSRERLIATLARLLELPLDSRSEWPEHLRGALGW